MCICTLFQQTMGSTYYSLHYHWMCSTKLRRRYIPSPWRSPFHGYLGGTDYLDDVIDYVSRQEEYHQTLTFEEELKGLLERHGIKYDAKYLL